MPIRTITAATILLALLAGSPGAAVAQPEIKASVFSTASGTSRSGSLALTSIVGQASPTGVVSRPLAAATYPQGKESFYLRAAILNAGKALLTIVL